MFNLLKGIVRKEEPVQMPDKVEEQQQEKDGGQDGKPKGIIIDKKSYLWLYFIGAFLVVGLCTKIKEVANPVDPTVLEMQRIQSLNGLENDIKTLELISRYFKSRQELDSLGLLNEQKADSTAVVDNRK